MDSQTPLPSPAALPTAEHALKPHRRRRGKVARLPRRVREQINTMLGDGLPYADIIAALGDQGKHLNKDNLINWHDGGYKDWLRDQPWLDQLQARLDFANNVLEDPESPKIREAGLCIAVKQMYDLIISFDPVAFLQKLSEDPASYSRVLNSLAKLAEIGLRYDREHTEAGRAVARETQRSKTAAGLTDDMLRQYEQEFKLLRRPAKAQESLSEVPTTADPSIGELKLDQQGPSDAKRA